jgi:hypothetical protein
MTSEVPNFKEIFEEVRLFVASGSDIIEDPVSPELNDVPTSVVPEVPKKVIGGIPVPQIYVNQYIGAIGVGNNIPTPTQLPSKQPR